MKAQIVMENLGVRLPHRLLFEGVNWTLYEGMRVTLAGRNGSGKSTLMRIMAQHSEGTVGQCSLVGKRGVKLGYLDQSLLDSAVLATKKTGDIDLSPCDYLVKHSPWAGDLERDPNETRWQIRKILSGLGFTEQSMDQSMGHLSGGWLLRMFLARTLLDEPDVLLLDEPTNHLDISSIQWLEEYLEREFKGSLILVTHDVSLQRRTTSALAVLHGGNFYFRKDQNDYLSFQDSLEVEKEHLQKNILSIDKRTAELQTFVDKYRAKARSASRAQSKLREIGVLNEERAILQDKLTRLEGFKFKLHFRFRQGASGGKFPVVAEDMSFRYSEDSPLILKDISFDIPRGQKVAIIGDNGAGKTTLLNVLAQRLKPTQGSVTLGHQVDLGYFGQHQLDELDLEASVVDNLKERAKDVSIEQLRGWLGAFGFTGNEEIDKKTKVLSGGERARLALLRILVTPINLCFLDEPTNHLDIETKELLKDAIKEFPATIVFVSHDRDFVEHVAERIIHISNDHKLTDHIGDLNSFFEKYPELVRHNEIRPKSEKKSSSDKPKGTGPKLSYEDRKKTKNRIRSLAKKVEAAEKEMETLGEEKEKLHVITSSTVFYEQTSEEQQNEILGRQQEIDKQLHQLLSEWETLSEELEDLKEKYPELV